MLRDLGLTSARWQVLCAIAGGSRTVAQIAREYELTRQGILWVVQGLLKDGIVVLTENPDHKRAKLVALTPHGQTLLNMVWERHREWSEQVGMKCSVKDVRAAIACLETIGKVVRAPDLADNEV